ncbi:MAG: hypothetical protein JWO05_1016 [Gemmatimonadetes bacterium]|nr:hypothetical protein [Gemmatimonadota bacterium]
MLLDRASRRTLLTVWAVGMLAQAALIGLAVAANRRSDAAWERKWGRFTESTPSARRMKVDSLPLPMNGVRRNDSAIAASESDTTPSPSREAAGTIYGGVLVVVIVTVATYLAIPLALLVFTALWYRAHRRASTTS